VPRPGAVPRLVPPGETPPSLSLSSLLTPGGGTQPRAPLASRGWPGRRPRPRPGRRPRRFARVCPGGWDARVDWGAVCRGRGQPILGPYPLSLLSLPYRVPNRDAAAAGCGRARDGAGGWRAAGAAGDGRRHWRPGPCPPPAPDDPSRSLGRRTWRRRRAWRAGVGRRGGGWVGSGVCTARRACRDRPSRAPLL